MESNKIFDLLKSEKEPIRAEALAQRLNIDKSQTNAQLYKLLREKRVKKIANPNGTNPRWMIDTDHNNLHDEIISLLKEEEGKLLPLKEIVSRLNSNKKEINSILYSLQRNGLVEKTSNADGTNPQWRYV